MTKIDIDKFVVDLISEYYRVYNVDSHTTRTWLDSVLEKQGFEVNNGKLVELCKSSVFDDNRKFNKGDFIVMEKDDVHKPLKIIQFTDDGYECEDGFIDYEDENLYRKWSICDAVCGDVLFNNEIGSVCIFSHFYGICDKNTDSSGNSVQESCLYSSANHNVDSFVCVCLLKGYGSLEPTLDININGIYEDSKGYVPASITQKNILYEKLRNAGYEWNSYSQKLKSIIECYGDEGLFVAGEWIVCENGIPMLVDEAKEDKYVLVDSKGCRQVFKKICVDSEYHKWVVEDAKDGDILVCVEDGEPFIYNGILTGDGCPDAYCGIDSDGDFVVSDDTFAASQRWTSDDVCPATIGQIERLMKKMQESGYMLDFKNKKLVRIDGDDLWSESDEKTVCQFVEFLNDETHQPFYLHPERRKEMILWIKSLKNHGNEWTAKDNGMINDFVGYVDYLYGCKDLTTDELHSAKYWFVNFKYMHLNLKKLYEKEENDGNAGCEYNNERHVVHTGDVLVCSNDGTLFVHDKNGKNINNKGYAICCVENIKYDRYANDDEKRKFFEELDKNGYVFDYEHGIVVNKTLFKKGDIVVVNDSGMITKIIDVSYTIDGNFLGYVIENGYIKSSNVCLLKKWTLKEHAKPGDILVSDDYVCTLKVYDETFKDYIVARWCMDLKNGNSNMDVMIPNDGLKPLTKESAVKFFKCIFGFKE